MSALCYTKPANSKNIDSMLKLSFSSLSGVCDDQISNSWEVWHTMV